MKLPGGNEDKGNLGWAWHDWIGEQYTWRLLHAAGIVTICSM
jgi:hypothetical protein